MKLSKTAFLSFLSLISVPCAFASPAKYVCSVWAETPRNQDKDTRRKCPGAEMPYSGDSYQKLGLDDCVALAKNAVGASEYVGCGITLPVVRAKYEFRENDESGQAVFKASGKFESIR
jgi:hypothetical protein